MVDDHQPGASWSKTGHKWGQILSVHKTTRNQNGIDSIPNSPQTSQNPKDPEVRWEEIGSLSLYGSRVILFRVVSDTLLPRAFLETKFALNGKKPDQVDIYGDRQVERHVLQRFLRQPLLFLRWSRRTGW